MKFMKFSMKNFKGINNSEIVLNLLPNSNIKTLVGLNESGKTTILEAINYFSNEKETLEALEFSEHLCDNPDELIPIAKRMNFNEEIIITAKLEVEPNDILLIAEHLKSKYNYHLTSEFKTVVISKILIFKNSRYKDLESKWDISLYIKKGKSKTNKELYVYDNEAWQDVIKFIRLLIPEIMFFPNFLFEIPEKIYLNLNEEKLSKKNKFYIKVIKDILDNIDSNLTIDEHIIKRIESENVADKNSLESLKLNMGREVTENIINEWNRIFSRELIQKEIDIIIDKDLEGIYLSFRIKENDGFFALKERSLGFRWFFAFLLIVYYRNLRSNNDKGVLFLIDEPASNLHATAQERLLESFSKIGGNCQIIYTTHSHYLINPQLLESTYIIKNNAISYEDDLDYNSNQTDIVIFPYRNFISKCRDQENYILPILETIDYKPAKLELNDKIIITEGKNDFYAIKIMEKIINESDILKIVPGTGSGNQECVIKLYLAWGYKFLILLDSDTEGKEQTKRYIDKFGKFIGTKIITYEDINSQWKNIAIEKLFEKEDQLKIINTIYLEQKRINKKKLHRALQEIFAKKAELEISKQTMDNFKILLKYLNEYKFEI